jgi:hypothetical protein
MSKRFICQQSEIVSIEASLVATKLALSAG